MGAISVVLIVESARDIASHDPDERSEIYYPALIAVGVAFVVKAILGAANFVYRKHYSQLEMLWIDCRKDLFVNA